MPLFPVFKTVFTTASVKEPDTGSQQVSLWVFGYGSLLWNPGFEIAETRPARLSGYARSFCMWSIHHRGTEENPGLVLALDQQDGAQCDGLALQAAAGTEAETLAYLRERELVSSAYLERTLPINLNDGRTVEAVTYVIDPDHVQYTTDMSLDRQAEVIAGATGGRGPNREYLFNTVDHLDKMGIMDAQLQWLRSRVQQL